MKREQFTSGLRDHAGYWLRRLSDAVHTSFERALAEHDVTVAQWSVLVAVYREHAHTIGEVAAFVGVDQGAVTRLVDRLAAKGLIERTNDLDDRRTVRLVLTERGSNLVPRLATAADRNDTHFFGVLDDQEYQRFTLTLAKLLATAEIPADGRWNIRQRPLEGELHVDQPNVHGTRDHEKCDDSA